MTRVVVAAAVIERDGAFLVTRRLPGAHLEGYWEFPGGKCEPGETVDDCVARELREELDVNVAIETALLTTTHSYPERVVELHFLRCRLLGEPTALLGQQMQWVARGDLRGLTFPPADAELIGLLMQA